MWTLLLACMATPGETTDTEAHTSPLTEESDTEASLDFGSGYPEQFLSGFVVDENNAALEGVEVCLVGADTSCDATGSDGGYVVGPVPEDEEVVFTLELNGRIPTVIPWRTDGFFGAGAMTFRFVLYDIDAPFLATSSPAADEGLVLATANTGKDEAYHRNLAEVTLSLSSDTTAVYLTPEGAPTDASATTERGQAVFLDVPQGELTLEAAASHPCVPWYGWGEQANTATLPVQAGWLTQVSVACP